MIVGPSGCGKTTLMKSLLTQGTAFQGPLRPCHYYYTEVWQPQFDAMKKRVVHFHAELPDVSDLHCWFGQTKGGGLMLENLMEESGNDKRVLDLFPKESHHRDITVLYLC